MSKEQFNPIDNKYKKVETYLRSIGKILLILKKVLLGRERPKT
ncbi:MAG: hypothetical protein UX81_C0016G0010 [Parcubacteria group bacterium GW2011_GWA2_47_12]|nr:MAG: hypothetical protein UX81_C0016G0010 [Parcubacteria group bacterium GW2011_GWA2_47_12]